MDETYRMLGSEHEADLEREAQKWRRAAEVRGHPRAPATGAEAHTDRKPGPFAPARLTAFLVRVARAESVRQPVHPR
jgi:hypothetical protein